LYLAIVLDALEPARDRPGHGTASPHRVSPSGPDTGRDAARGLRLHRYNQRCRHSSLGYLSPMAYEKRELSPVIPKVAVPAVGL